MKIENIIVNGKTYKVQTMSVLDTFTLHLEVGKHLGNIVGILIEGIQAKNLPLQKIIEAFQGLENPESIVKIQRKVMAQVITPKNTFLGDEVAIEEWFSQNPNDLWEVFIKALFVLVGEYLPNFGTGEPAKATEEASQSQTNTD